MPSSLEEKFLKAWAEFGRGRIPEREYRFHEIRRYRFDFAWPAHKIAVELDGLGGGHQSVVGLTSDRDKQNLAVLRGWRVFRFTPKHFGSAKTRKHVVNIILTALRQCNS